MNELTNAAFDPVTKTAEFKVCAVRIEKRLNKLDGVEATVNYATERARVTAPAGVSSDDLVAQVEAAGYKARVPAPVRTASSEDGSAHQHESEPIETLRTRLLISTVLAVPVVLLAMIPALQFRNWQWLSFALAGPVVVYGGWPFHRAAWVNQRHGVARMTSHRFVQPDSPLLQASEFATGLHVVANFSVEPYTISDGRTVAAQSAVVDE